MIRKINLIPMAGLGKRFENAGYKTPKPLIDINGKPMFVRAVESLPKADKIIFVCLRRHIKKFKLDKIIKSYFPKSIVIIAKKKKKKKNRK
jgi:NDP-sugar pyrophosphorylase family protein